MIWLDSFSHSFSGPSRNCQLFAAAATLPLLVSSWRCSGWERLDWRCWSGGADLHWGLCWAESLGLTCRPGCQCWLHWSSSLENHAASDGLSLLFDDKKVSGVIFHSSFRLSVECLHYSECWGCSLWNCCCRCGVLSHFRQKPDFGDDSTPEQISHPELQLVSPELWLDYAVGVL